MSEVSNFRACAGIFLEKLSPGGGGGHFLKLKGLALYQDCPLFPCLSTIEGGGVVTKKISLLTCNNECHNSEPVFLCM